MELRTEMGVARLADFSGNPDQYAGLQRPLNEVRNEGEHHPAEREVSEAISRVREVAGFLRASDERISDLEAGLQAITERARRDLKAAQERAEQAESRVSAQAARADAAELRAREAEEHLSKIMAVIEEELASGLPTAG